MILRMSEVKPTREEALASLTEAGMRSSQVRGADAQLGWILLLLVVADLGIASLISLAFHSAGPAVLAIYLTTLGMVVVVLVRIRVYSRTGLRVFSVSATAFTIWNALVSGVSVAAKWWGPTQPTYHFGVSAVIGVLPLLVGIWLLFRKRS